MEKSFNLHSFTASVQHYRTSEDFEWAHEWAVLCEFCLLWLGPYEELHTTAVKHTQPGDLIRRAPI